MKAISSKYVLVKKLDEKQVEDGFKVVTIGDSFIFKGTVAKVPDCPLFIDNVRIAVGDTVMFSKYSPDTQEVDIEGEKMKMIKSEDILAII